MKRVVHLTDKFKICCRKCGSEMVDLSTDVCGECGTFITANCTFCKNEYDYHKFEQIEENG